MANIRFKGGNASERLDLTTVKQGDMLQTRHDPNGSEDSDKGIPFGLCQATPVFECTTAGATASKVASLISDETFPDFVLYNGRQIMVHFTHGNAVDSPTLNVGGVAYPIRLQNQKSTVVIGEGCWGDDVWLSFMFVSDGTNSYWILLGHNIAKQRSDATSGYTIYADGRIEYPIQKVQKSVDTVEAYSSAVEIDYSNIPSTAEILSVTIDTYAGFISNNIEYVVMGGGGNLSTITRPYLFKVQSNVLQRVRIVYEVVYRNKVLG